MTTLLFLLCNLFSRVKSPKDKQPGNVGLFIYYSMDVLINFWALTKEPSSMPDSSGIMRVLGIL